MLDNEVRLGGTVEQVTVRPAKDWVNGSLKLKTPTFETWVKIGGLSVGDKALERIQALPGKHVVLQGRLSSYDLKAKPPDYPDARTVWELAIGKNGYWLGIPNGVNVAFCVGKVKRTKVADDGSVRAEIGIRYSKPSTNDFGTYSARVRCPAGTTLQVEQEIFFTGHLMVDSLGVLLDATAVISRP
jgi:hypothetical protein